MTIKGLTAQQVEESRQKHGGNQMTEKEQASFWKKLLGNFGDPMIKILCVALLINVIFTFLGQTEWYESVGIALAVILATMVSTFSEYRNENAFQKLQEEASRILCKVYRDGEIREIPIGEIVVDDCVLLQNGDKIPADGVMIDGSIQVDQSVLNGESKECTKVVIPEDYEDESKALDFLNPYKVFRGAVVCQGNGVMRVTTVGDHSVYGQIASELQTDEERDSPLKAKLRHLAHGISKFGYLGGIAIAVAVLFQRIVVQNGFDPAQIALYCSDWMALAADALQAVMLAVIIIVMAVPEGLPLMIAIVSAQNMGKMLKDQVLVRKVTGIETAGSLNLLLSDKTGTITKGKLEAVVFVDGSSREYRTIQDVGGNLSELLSLSVRSNTAAVVSGEGARIVGGNATERAILGFAAGEQRGSEVVLSSIPFNSTNKYSAATVSGAYQLTLIKGAPEKILRQCRSYYAQDGQRLTMSEEEHWSLEKKIDALAGRAIRVLALATCDNEIIDQRLPEGDWTLVGIMGIRDEVRPESVTAIDQVRQAGVQVVMITGDRKDTAVAIAKDAGLLQKEEELVLTSDELAQMSDGEIKEILPQIRVIARALPSDKSRLVRLGQELNLVVGMTGDGVNDSPALKKADVGFAMGGGTEVAKEAGDIVILDDNFRSIEKAILYGRTIFSSIRKFIVFQLTINVAAVLISFAAPLLGMENPLSIIQILWINLVMDTLAALAFGGEPALDRYMREKPKRREEPIISRDMASSILVGSLWVFGVSLLLLLSPVLRSLFRYAPDDIYHMTGYFCFFIFAAFFNAFNARTERRSLFDHMSGNAGFLKIMGLIAIIQVLLTYFGGAIFRCHGLNLTEWAVVLALAFTIIPVDLLRKSFLRLMGKGSRNQ